MNTVKVEKLLEIGIALSKEKDADRLLETILTAAMEMTGCDGGTLYTVKDGELAFRIMITRSMGILKGGRHGPIELPPVKMSRQNVCAYAVIDRTLINVADVYESRQYDFSGPRNYDAMTGYKTTSMLVVPMENDYGDMIGVLQLINAQDPAGRTVSFDAAYEPVILSLASQAAICLTNMNYSAEITELLDSFVRVMSTAIDARSPYNANHTRNMVRYGERFIAWLAETGNAWAFTEMAKREFLMSVWLHDVGKLVTPLEIMDKESRLGARLPEVLHRFEVMALINRINLLSGAVSDAEFREREGLLIGAKDLIGRINRAGFLSDEVLDEIRLLAGRAYHDLDGTPHPWLTPEEAASLFVRKGTLTDEERAVMESHVLMTERMLKEMSFSRNYKKVPEWAGAHHEFLNGRGYPKRLKGDQIPREVRLLTILDIFDALTARDRPYKPAVPLERALGIMDAMAGDGQLDGEILALFKACAPWEGEHRHETVRQLGLSLNAEAAP